MEPRPHRRAVLASLAACAAAPALAADPHPGFDPALLTRATGRASRMPQLRSLLIARDGATAFARAFRGRDLYTPANVKSVSKTLLAALVGAALDRRVFDSVDQPVAPLLADRIPTRAHPDVAKITVRHLLTMRAGLQGTSGSGYMPWVSTPDWLADALGRPMIDRPGGRWIYSTGSSHILGVALAQAAGRDLRALAQDWLGEPLGVTFPGWTRCPTGDYLGGNDMQVSPVALLRFGEMMRNGGVWAGAQVLPADWVAQSWRAQTKSTGSRHAYGYGWFLSVAHGHEVAFARGYGGQMLYVAPSLGLVATATSDPHQPGRLRGHVGWLNTLFADEIMPAALAARGTAWPP
jgi:CubicO group peptidase (beta-lactamase class C family)